MTIIHQDFADYLFDMETFDFFDICGLNQSSFGCVRFVTDFVLPLNGKLDPQHQTQRDFIMTQLKKLKEEVDWCPSFQKLVDLAIKIEDMRVLKKYLRLSLNHDFEFLFQLNIQGNEVIGGYTYQKDSVEKLHRHLSKAFITKLEEIFFLKIRILLKNTKPFYW